MEADDKKTFDFGPTLGKTNELYRGDEIFLSRKMKNPPPLIFEIEKL